MTKEQRLLMAFNERHQALLEDGYRDIVATCNNGVHYVKMRHDNGNYVSVTAYNHDNSIVQRTNGKIVHDETLC